MAERRRVTCGAVTSDLTAATFEPHIGTVFTIANDDGDVPLTLASVHREPEQPHAPRPDPFSLTFTAPEGYGFTQGMFTLRHDALGTLDIFLIPRAPLKDRLSRLEAVFN